MDDDILTAARAMARQQHRSLGEVVSELARAALQPRGGGQERNGVPLLPVREGRPLVTLETVNALRDEAP